MSDVEQRQEAEEESPACRLLWLMAGVIIMEDVVQGQRRRRESKSAKRLTSSMVTTVETNGAFTADEEEYYQLKRSEITPDMKWVLLEAISMRHEEDPQLTLDEMCFWSGIKSSWVKDWAKDDSNWQEVVDLFEKEMEVPRIGVC